MIEAKAGRVAAEVVSAKPLDPAQLVADHRRAREAVGQEGRRHQARGPELLGGVVAKVGDTVYDGSLRTQLRNLRDELTK